MKANSNHGQKLVGEQGLSGNKHETEHHYEFLNILEEDMVDLLCLDFYIIGVYQTNSGHGYVDLH